MAQTEFNNCPKCGIGKRKPTGGAAVSNDPQTGKETGSYREYKCDNCGYPEGGKAIVLGVNEQLNMTDSPRPPSDDNKRNSDNDNNNNSSGDGGGGGVPPASSSSTPYPDELNNRVHFKLNAARRHLENLTELERKAGSLAAAAGEVRTQAEIDIHFLAINLTI